MKKIISIILVFTICMATYTSVAFADADLLVTSDMPNNTAEEIIADGETDTESIQDIADIDETLTIPTASEILENSDDHETDPVENEIPEVIEDEQAGEPETDENIEPEASGDAEAESDPAEIDAPENSEDEQPAEPEDEQTVEPEDEQTVEPEDKNGFEENENQQESTETADEPEKSEKNSQGSELQNELEKIKEYMQPAEDEILSSIEVVVPGRPEAVSGSRMDFFSVYDDEQEQLQNFITELYGEKSSLTFSYLFLGAKMPFISDSEKVVSYVHNFALNVKDREVLIALYSSMIEEESFETEIDVIYSSDDTESLYFKTFDGSLIELSKVSYFGTDGKKIARIRLTDDVLSSIAYFRNSYCGVEVFKLVGANEDSDITIHEINISSAKNSYAVIRGMDEDCHYEEPAAGLSVTSTDGEYVGVLFASQNGIISISGSANSAIELMEGFEHSHVLISTDLDKQIFDVYIPSDDPQTVIEKVLDEAQNTLPDNLDPKLDPATKPEDGEDEESGDSDEDKTEDDPDSEKTATDTDLNVTTDTDFNVATDTDLDYEFEIEEIPDATQVEFIGTEDIQDVTSIDEAAAEETEEEVSDSTSIDFYGSEAGQETTDESAADADIVPDAAPIQNEAQPDATPIPAEAPAAE